MGKLRHFRTLTSCIIGLMVILFSNTFAFAKVVGFVVVGNNGEYYEYDYDGLLQSYVIYTLGAKAPLFLDYREKKLRAYLDDINGYIDYENVLETYVKASVAKKSFDMHKYTASQQAKKAAMPGEVYVVTLGSDGKLKYTKKILETVADILAALNKAATAADLEALVTSKASQMGLDLADYKKLNRYSQKAALNEVLAKRPQQGFDSLDRFKRTFNEAVAAVKPALDAALQAVNAASSGAGMKKALLDHDAVLELGLKRYKLTAAEQDTLASRMLPLRPFASPKELQRILHTVVISVRSGFTVNHARYDYTLNRMLDIQMGLKGCPPQTDLYGGGWKNARREDVAYYLDPYNFIDMDYDGSLVESIRILAEPNLKVRQRPTTQSPQLKDATGSLISVWLNQVYAILGQAQAEAGTAPGSEGVWYKIRVSNTEGWVCGKYCQVIGGSFSATSMFQFLLLSGSAGSTVEDLDRILAGKGVLNGMGSVFMQASRNNNINEIFLVSLALHETGNGTSTLARGIEVPDKENLFPGKEFVTVYNMFGIGAYDSNPNYHGAERAYNERWFTPEAAILGGAKFASAHYVNNPSYFQNTLYKMRWNPNRPGNHQYATDIGWAAKQVSRIRGYYNLAENYTLTFEIPRFKE